MSLADHQAAVQRARLTPAQHRVLRRAQMVGRAEGLALAGTALVLTHDSFAQRGSWEPLVSRGLLEQLGDRLHITHAGRELLRELG